ncbi:uncharacterized protein BDV14DRAFT_195434 [Aspergillus stella-maris]|uniref:uncharacterized protein n=1 Tax=Aspergillus stella-maris TaxID=1810926 RepID=UPI003CCD7BF7
MPTCTPPAHCTQCKPPYDELISLINSKDGADPVIPNPRYLTCLPGTYPVIFNVPEQHTTREIGDVVSLADRDLTPDARSLSSETPHYHNKISYMFDLREKVDISAETSTMSVCTATTDCSACNDALIHIHQHTRYGTFIADHHLTFSSSHYPVTFIAEKSSAYDHSTKVEI